MALNSNKLTHLVGPIRGVIEYGLATIRSETPKGAAYDRERHERLVALACKEANLRIIGPHAISYLTPAIEDFWYIGKGAIEFAQKLTADRKNAQDIVIRSVPALCFPAFMPDDDGQWNDIKSDWSGVRETIGLFVPESKLDYMVTDDKENAIRYCSGALVDMDSYTTPTSGCPAQGPVLEKLFAKYVTTILAD